MMGTQRVRALKFGAFWAVGCTLGISLPADREQAHAQEVVVNHQPLVQYGPLWDTYAVEKAAESSARSVPCSCTKCRKSSSNPLRRAMGALSNGFDRLMFGSTTSPSQCTDSACDRQGDASCDDGCAAGFEPLDSPIPTPVAPFIGSGALPSPQPMLMPMPGSSLPISPQVPHSPPPRAGGSTKSVKPGITPSPGSEIPTNKVQSEGSRSPLPFQKQRQTVPSPPADDSLTDPFLDDPIPQAKRQSVQKAGYFD
jgi:hypothetical protein